MILNAYGIHVTPGQLLDAMNPDGFDDTGMLRWNVLMDKYPDITWMESWYTTVFTKFQGQKMDDVDRRIARIENRVFPFALATESAGSTRIIK